MEALISARDLTAKTLEESNRVSTATRTISCSLRRLNSELLLSSDLLRSLHRRTSTLSALSLHADHATGPASAHSSVLLLQRSLSTAHPSPDLSGYLASVSRLEQALSFLTDNCALAIHWLNDAASLLDESSAADHGYASNVKRSLAVLEELRTLELRERLPGGALCLAMDKLQIELRRILETEIQSDHDIVVDKLRPVVDRLRSNGRGSTVGPIYVEARVSAVRSKLLPETAGGVAQWGRYLESAVTQVVALEHRICSGLGISMESYAEVVAESGFLRLLGLGREVAGAGKRDAMRLLKLLDVFGAVESLRPEFNRLFGGKECELVQGVTRELVRGVVEGAWEIFCQLADEVERQQQPAPALSMSSGEVDPVPPLVAFVTHYCLALADDKYRPPLLQVLSIHQTWHPASHRHLRLPPHQLLIDEICRILRALEAKFIKWSNNRWGDANSSFLVNNYRYLYQHLMDSELGNLLGEEWLEEYLHKIDLYAQPDCGKQLPCQDGITLGRRMTAYTST